MIATLEQGLPGLPRLRRFLNTEEPARRALGPSAIVVLVELVIMTALDMVDKPWSSVIETLVDAIVLAVVAVGGLKVAARLWPSRWLPVLPNARLVVFGLLLFTGETLLHTVLSPLARSGWDIAQIVVNAALMGGLAWAGLTWMLWSADILSASQTGAQSTRIARYAALAMGAILVTFTVVFAAIMSIQTTQRDGERETASLIERMTRVRATAQRISKLDMAARMAPGRRAEIAGQLEREVPLLTAEVADVLQMLARRPTLSNQIRSEFGITAALLGGHVAENMAGLAVWPHDASPLADHLYEQAEELVSALRYEARREALNNDRAGLLSAGALVLALLLTGFVIVRPIVRFIGLQVGTQAQIEKELKDSLARLRSYQQALDHQFIFAATDRSGRIVDVNAQFCRISGYTREELIGKTHRILNSGQHPPGFFAEMWRTIAAGGTWTGEICNRAKDGRLYWVRTVVFPIFDSTGKVEQYAAIRTDVTETKLSHQLLEEAVAAVPDGFVIYDADDRLIVCNEAYRKIYAASAPAIVPGATFREILEYGLREGQYPEAGSSEAERAEWLSKRLAAHRLAIADTRQQLPNGRWLQIRERTTRSGYKVGFRTDVTEIQLQAATLDTILQNFPGGIVLIDRDLRVRATNATYRQLLGVPDSLFAGGPPAIDEIFRWNAARGDYGPGDVEEHVRMRMERIVAAEPHVYERRRRDGTVLEVRGAPLPGGGFVTIYLDVTERKEKAEALAAALVKLESFAAHAPAAVAMFDRNLRYLAYTKRWLSDYGLEGQDLHGLHHYDVLPNVPNSWKAVHQRALHGAVEQCDGEIYDCPNRGPMNLRWEVRPWHDAGGEIGGIVMLTEDITERVAMEATSRANAEQFRSLFQLAPVGVALSDAQSGRLTLVSESLAALTGYAPGELVGKPIQQLLAPEHRHLLGSGAADGDVRFGPIEVEYIAKDSSRVPTLLSGIQVSDSDGRPLRLTIAQDITERRETEQRLWRLANLDSLTGLANRLLFHERLESTLKAAQRTGAQFAVGLIDLDRFKEINDTYGHDQGDVLLKVVAERIGAVVREADTVARLGGDEFAFILGAVDGVVSLHRPLQKMLATMEEPIMIGGAARRCAMSIGVTVYPADATSAVELLKNADIALYRAKGAGRGRVEFFSPEMRSSVERSARLKSELETALLTDQFEIFYQPIFALPDTRVTSVEALLRWRHPRLGLVSPEAFREVFDEAKLSAAIGEKVIALVARDLEALQQRGTPLPRVAINATSADFATGTYLARLEALLARTGLAPRDVCVEITEDMFLGRGAGTTLDTIKALSVAGFEIALDDFGTGYASLSHLRQFPVQRIKIDRSFVADMEHDPSDAAIVRAIAFLAQSLDLRVTAEGVDSDGQVDMLRLLGVDSLQGYLLSKPMPLAQLASMLEGERRAHARTA